MQRDLIAVPEHWKVGQVIDYLALDRRAGDRFLGSVRRLARPPPGRHLQAVDHPALAARSRGRRHHEAQADADPGRHGPGGSGAAVPEICADLGRGGRSQRAGWSA